MGTSAASLIVAGHGQISQLVLPAGWIEGDPSESGARLLRPFNLPGNVDVEICLYYRGGPMSDNSAELFANLLKEPAHTLSQHEYDLIWEVLEHASDPRAFQMEKAETIDLNGKRVLAVLGFWPASGLKSYMLMLDADGTGRFVQEIYYSAPADLYATYLSMAQASLQSIEWLQMQ
jgi:hypothetical protein